VAIVWSIAPLPLVLGHTAPPAPAQVQVKSVNPNGAGSFTTVPSALTLPVFVTTSVYGIEPLTGTEVAVVLFRMLICGDGASVTLSLHGGGVPFGAQTPPAGGVALATFVTLAGGLFETLASIEYATRLPGGKIAIVSSIAPLPEAAGHSAPTNAVQVQSNSVMPAGSGSVTTVPPAPMVPTLRTLTT
jgi:hypothetical protein